ncbi:hypothetical protein GCM10010493_31000 [Streptomyces lavendulae subsp. grasserius]
MRDLAARHPTVHLGMPAFRSVASSRAATQSSEARVRSRSPEDYKEGMTVFLCSKCGTAITRVLAELAAGP